MSYQWILTPIRIPEINAVMFRPGASDLQKFNGRMLIIPVPEQLIDKSVGPISLSPSFFSDELSDIEVLKPVLNLSIDPEPPASYMLKPKLKRWESTKYLQWVKSQPCCICNAIADDAHHIIGHGQGGMATKSHDLFAIPLCRVHHRNLHDDQKGWEAKHGSQVILLFRFLDRSIGLGVFG
ncbi:hypothetical protein C9446_11750 [Providencia heimbachae]|uniref:DUF968 domain-containing protein n=1 Tax=Providencia heimbachae TaxID=333962 RepID=UPI0010BE66F8|nr:hypothetical protein C9446_11750 [Providencia heimbachae]